MSYKEYTCPRCKRVHAAISLAEAEKAAGEIGDMSHYYRCFACSTPTSQFVPAKLGDVPDGCTLTVVVVPGAWGA